MLYQALRRLGSQAPKLQQQLTGKPLTRGFAGGEYAKPKVDTSLDHVFGDSSQKLAYNFEPMGMGSLFVRSVVITGVFLFPIWLFLSDDYKYQKFQEELAAARAKRAAADS